MNIDTLIEMASSVHLSQWVRSGSDERSGMFFVAPPGALKTTIARIMDEYKYTLLCSDLNVRTLQDMKEQILAGAIRTIIFPEFEKLYQRNRSVAMNLEGTIKALAAEGFYRASFQNQMIQSVPARCVIIGAITTSFFERKYTEWQSNGFLRRFLWPNFSLKGIERLEDSALKLERATLTNTPFDARIPTQQIVPVITEEDKALVSYMVRHIPYSVSSIFMLQKILAVLKWKHGGEKATTIMRDFAPCLTKAGGTLCLDEIP